MVVLDFDLKPPLLLKERGQPGDQSGQFTFRAYLRTIFDLYNRKGFGSTLSGWNSFGRRIQVGTIGSMFRLRVSLETFQVM